MRTASEDTTNESASVACTTYGCESWTFMTDVSFWAHVKIASRIVSYRIKEQVLSLVEETTEKD